MYWACWLSLAMADLTATGIYLRYWFPWLPQWVGPLVIVILLMLINMVNVGLFGELESWFSMIKVMAIVVLIITGAVMLLLHTHVKGGYVSLTNLVNHGGFFPTGIWGFLLSFQMVVFAFVGVEIVGQTASETANPQKDIPKAINTLPVRIGLFMWAQCWQLCLFIHGITLQLLQVPLSRSLPASVLQRLQGF